MSIFLPQCLRVKCKPVLLRCGYIAIKASKENPLKIANYFNKHFADVPNRLVKSLPLKKKHFSEYLKSSTCQSMFTWPTCPKQLANILKNSKNKLQGLDKIIGTLIKFGEILFNIELDPFSLQYSFITSGNGIIKLFHFFHRNF